MITAKTHHTIVNIQYAALQGAYWMAYCVMLGFAAAYLAGEGFGNAAIGTILAASSALAVFIQSVAAAISDSGKKNAVANLTVLFFIAIIAISLSLYPVTGRRIPMAALMLVGPALLMAIQPLLTSICFLEQRNGVTINFGIARGIGSLLYALISIIAGNLLERFGFSLFPALCASTLTCALLIAFSFRKKKSDLGVGDAKSARAGNAAVSESKNPAGAGMMAFVRENPAFVFFCFGVFLVFFDHALIGNFLIRVVRNVGGNVADMGKCLSLSAVLELPAMALFWRFRKKIRCVTALKFSCVFFFFKHALTLFAHSMAALYFAQSLQIGAFALFLPAATYYAAETFPASDMVKAQSCILASITLSGVFASLIGGIALEKLGVFTTLLIGLTVSLSGTVTMFLALRVPRQAES